MVGHYQDVQIESMNGFYPDDTNSATIPTLKVEGDGNGQYTLSMKTASANAATYYFTIESLTDQTTIATLPSSTASTTISHLHDCVQGKNLTHRGRNGQTKIFKIQGDADFNGTLNVVNHANTSSVATQFMNGKRTSGTVPIGELIFSNNNDSVATVAGYRDGANDKGSLLFQTQDGSNGFGTRLTIKADGVSTFEKNLRTNGNLQIIGAAAEIWIGDSLSGTDGGFIKWNSTNDYLYIGNSYNSAFNEDIKIDNTGDVTLKENLHLYDDKKIKLGSGDDLQLYHTGSHSTIKSKEGSFYIQQEKQDGNLIFQADNGENNATSADYFYLDGGSAVHDGTNTTEMYTIWKDKSRIALGNGKDLQLYHDGSNSFIDETGAGSLVLKTGALLVRNPSDASMLDAQSGGAINLYHNGTKKFETTSGGVEITGGITGTLTNSILINYTGSDANSNDAGIKIMNDSSDWGMYIRKHNDGNGHATTYGLRIDGGNDHALWISDAQGGSPTFEVNDSGVITEGRAVAYDAGDKIIAAHEHDEVITDSDANYKRMARIVVSKAGSISVKWEGFISSGTYYWGWAVARNNGTNTAMSTPSNILKHGHFSSASPNGLASGVSASVHALRQFDVDISEIRPGDQIELWMRSSTASGGLVTGNGQTLHCKNFRISTNISTIETNAYFNGTTTISNVAVDERYGGESWSKYLTFDAADSGGGGMVWSRQGTSYNRGILSNHGDLQLVRTQSNSNQGSIVKDLIIDNAGKVGIGTVTTAGGFNVNNPTSGSFYNMSNTDSGNHNYTNSGSNGRTLTTNGAGWITDGRDPILTLSSAGNSNSTAIGYSLGLNLYNHSSTNSTHSPLITFSALSESGNYSSVYGAIGGKKTGKGADTNWNTGEIHFWTAGPDGSGSASYMTSASAMMIDATQNVGIGTMAPGRKLTVTSDVSGDANNLLLANENDTDGDSASIGFSMLSNNTYVKAGIFFKRNTTQGRGDLIFATNNEVNGNNVGVANEIMSIRNTGAIEIKGTSTTLNGKAFITNTNALMTVGSTQSSGVPKDMAFFNGATRMTIKATTGEVGIGTDSPGSYNAHGKNLVVAGGGNVGITIDGAATSSCSICFADGTSSTASIAGKIEYDHSSDAMEFRTAAVTRMKLNSTSLIVSGDVVAYGSPSDKRLKENIKPIESALDKAMKLQGVTFDWKKSDSILDIKEDIGFIAQDVKEVVPELVRENEDGMLSMRHQGVAPILLEAIKELKAEIDELKKQIK
jgi:hypothetical protein